MVRILPLLLFVSCANKVNYQPHEEGDADTDADSDADSDSDSDVEPPEDIEFAGLVEADVETEQGDFECRGEFEALLTAAGEVTGSANCEARGVEFSGDLWGEVGDNGFGGTWAVTLVYGDWDTTFDLDLRGIVDENRFAVDIEGGESWIQVDGEMMGEPR